MGRHKKSKIQFQYTISPEDCDFGQSSVFGISKRAKNAIIEIHRHNYKSAAGLMDLKFYLQREMAYIKTALSRRSQYDNRPMPDLQSIAESVHVMTEIIKHIPNNLFIRLPYDSYKHGQLKRDWELEVDKHLTPLNESDILEEERFKDIKKNKVIADLISRELEKPHFKLYHPELIARRNQLMKDWEAAQLPDSEYQKFRQQWMKKHADDF